MNATKAPYEFHAAEMSYFSAKLRPALRYKELWYREVMPDYQKLRARTGLTFIPVLFTPEDEAWQDTSDILDALELRHPEPPLTPTTPLQRIAAYLLELYADEVALLPAMHYRWSFAESEAKARAEFAANSRDAAASGRFADRMKGSLPFLGVHEHAKPAVEAHTRDLLAALSAHFEMHRFLLGDRMSLGDCALMGPFYAHLYLDAVPGRLLRETALPVCGWIERCNHPDSRDVQRARDLQRAGDLQKAADQKGWLADDALAPTLRSVLAEMARDGVPLLLAAARAVEAWADARPAEPAAPPRVVGLHQTQLRGAAITRGTSVYTLWMLQRSLDAYRALAPAEKTRVDSALAGTGWEELLAYRPRHRLVKRNFQLAWA